MDLIVFLVVLTPNSYNRYKLTKVWLQSFLIHFASRLRFANRERDGGYDDPRAATLEGSSVEPLDNVYLTLRDHSLMSTSLRPFTNH